MNVLGKEAKFTIGDRVKVITPRDPNRGKVAAVRSIAMRGKPDRFAYDVEFSADETWYDEHELAHDPH